MLEKSKYPPCREKEMNITAFKIYELDLYVKYMNIDLSQNIMT